MLTGTILALGFLHGLGADHLMAIAVLSVATPLGPSRYGRALWMATRFAFGHALLLSLGAALVLAFGWQVPGSIERGGEIAGGWLLLVLGAGGVWLVLTGRVYLHTHAHAHADNRTHTHWHLHIGRRDDHRPAPVHATLPGIMGAVFAVSGLRALIVALPLWGVQDSLPVLVMLIAVFAMGILASMSLFGIVLTHVLGTPRMTAHAARISAAVTALASMALGLYWIQ